jgi:hypothetical protein
LPNFGDEIDFFADFSHIENMQYYAKKEKHASGDLPYNSWKEQ